MTTLYTFVDSPLGPLLLTSDGCALTGLFMGDHKHGPAVEEGWVRDEEAMPLIEAKRQLAAYFTGTRTEFDLPLSPTGTEFQQRVWHELCRIGYGETLSYGELAHRIGNANASRAVGLANGRNPISIIVPCHRVIGANGKLVGYGGGIDRKAVLLDFERAVQANGPHPLVSND
jgi:methylated-DNA-[protein]-cysteine S-methyltransferase